MYLTVINESRKMGCTCEPTRTLATSFIYILFFFQDLKVFVVSYVNSLRASSPIWASETSLAKTRERTAKPRGAEERKACNDPLQIFICNSPRRREIPLAEK